MTLSTPRGTRKTLSYDGLGTPRSSGRDRVQAAGGQWAAAKNPPGRQCGALEGAVCPDGLERVRGTARMEPAPTHEQTAQRRSVRGQDRDEEPTEGSAQHASQLSHQRISPASISSRRISSIRSGAFERPKGPRATRTMSCPSRTHGQSARDASRSRRRARLRATAPPTRFPVTQAAREGPGRGATYSTTRSDLWGLPSRSVRRMEEGSTRSDAEPGPALPTAPGEDGSPVAGAHPGSEAVGALPPARAGLVSALH